MAEVNDTDAAPPGTTTPTAEGTKFIELFPGNALSASETEAVTLCSPTQLLVFAGAEDSGKTTVLASIYERLNKGPFAGYRFAGSRSLLGFEQICHLSRIASGRQVPFTQRTVPTEEGVYYHLALKGTGSRARRRHVLLSAVSGELFRQARDFRDDCTRLTFLHRANVIVILIDGARLTMLEKRTSAQAAPASILDSFLDAKMVPPGCRAEFVFSKLDCIVAAGKSAIEFQKKTREMLERRFRDRVPRLKFREIAARPDPMRVKEPFEDGLEHAFAAWTEPEAVSPIEGSVAAAPEGGMREFSKFGWRYFRRTRGDQS